MASNTDCLVLKVIHYLAPTLVALYAVSSTAVATCLLPPSRASRISSITPHGRNICKWLTLLATLGYVAESIIYALRAIVEPGWWAPNDLVAYVMLSLVAWSCISVALDESESSFWPTFIGSWALAAVMETFIWCLSYPTAEKLNGYEIVRLCVQATRTTILSVNCVVFLFSRSRSLSETDPESRPLLGGLDDPNYGAHQSPSASKKNEDHSEQARRILEERGGWLAYIKEFRILILHILPLKSRRVQIYIGIVLFIILSQRGLNVLVPRQMGILVDKLTMANGTGQLPWKEFGLYALFRLIDETVFGPVRDNLSLRLRTLSVRNIACFAFDHAMSLSLEYHENKDTGETIEAMKLGYSVTNLLDMVFFRSIPFFLDLWIAAGFITYLFDIYFACVLLVVAVAYFLATYKLTSRTAKAGRKSVDKRCEQSKMMYECMSNWQTIAYFNRQQYEQNRCRNAKAAQMDSHVGYVTTYQYMSVCQSLIMLIGFVAVMLLGAYRVSQGVRPIGSFVALTLYWSQLTRPINEMAGFFKDISQRFIESERLLRLLRERPSVLDAPDARPLHVLAGGAEYKAVSFAYDKRKSTIKNMSFRVAPGTTVALVGETGSGKSTTCKLLFRFYDVADGSIEIDGQDVRTVTQESLHEAIGVVPQDPSLFNTSILENVRYGRLDATDEDIHEACKAAAIHEKILSFPDGYNSTVGERGVKLSGGELQRIAIARVFVKSPKIVILDEATSAVDSSTELLIQRALHNLTTGRTTFVIAHRLSTIMGAELILVVDNGQIIERGTHDELLRQQGKYHELWSQQMSRGPPKRPGEADNISLLDFPAPLDQVDGVCESKPPVQIRHSKSAHLQNLCCIKKRHRKGHPEDDSEDEAEEERLDMTDAEYEAYKPTVTGPLRELSPKPTMERESNVSRRSTIKSFGGHHPSFLPRQHTSKGFQSPQLVPQGLDQRRRKSSGLSSSVPSHYYPLPTPASEQSAASAPSPHLPPLNLEAPIQDLETRTRGESSGSESTGEAFYTPTSVRTSLESKDQNRHHD